MISIIITACKEEKTISKAIESILKNKIQEEFEILVVAPDKETLNKAQEFSINNRIILIQDPGKGKPAALNLAFKRAKGDILILTDGDVFIGTDSIKPILEKFRDKKIGAVSGRPVSLNDKKSMLGFWSHLLTDIADSRRKKAILLKKKFVCSGYLYAMRAGVVPEIPEETLSDDGFISHLIYKKGYKIGYSPNSLVYVKFPTNLKDWIKQKKRSAGGYNQIKKWTKAEIRSFSKESAGLFQVFKYHKNIKEFFYTILLIFTRIYLWAIIFKDINLKKKSLKKMWLRIDSTK